MSDPPWMPSDRKLRLWACACWRLVPAPKLTTAWYEALRQLEELAEGDRSEFTRSAKGFICACLGVDELLRHLSGLWLGDDQTADQRAENARRCAALLREVVGNPFRRPTLRHPMPWVVTNLALNLYHERDFASLPVLADALEEYGCAHSHPQHRFSQSNPLDHLRGPGPHALGCWALDLVLGKE